MNDPSDYFSVDFDRAGDHLTVYVGGELDAFSAPVLLEDVDRRVDAGTKLVWLDLSAVSFCDSAALVAMTRFHEQIVERGTRLKIYQPSQAITRVIDIIGVGNSIPVYRSSSERSPRSASQSPDAAS